MRLNEQRAPLSFAISPVHVLRVCGPRNFGFVQFLPRFVSRLSGTHHPDFVPALARFVSGILVLILAAHRKPRYLRFAC